MKPIAPSHAVLGVLRSLAQANFGYQDVKTISQAANMHLVDDEPELGYVRLDLRPSADEDSQVLLSVLVSESGRPPRAFLPLYYFEHFDASREPFDQVYRSLSESLTSTLGPPSSHGEYRYPHREGWPYS